MSSDLKVLIVGAGLIGTSIALGLKSSGIPVWIEDEDPSHEAIAQNLIGRDQIPDDQVTLVIVATPISAISSVLQAAKDRYSQASLIDIGGLKAELNDEVEGFPALARRFCGSHPMAGREIAGPLAARGDLFQGRIWLYCPTRFTEDLVLTRTLELIKVLGSTPVELESEGHDRVIAAISHLPQITSSLLALTLEDLATEELALAGQGLRDVSRLAASKSELWSELLHANRSALKPFIDKLIKNLTDIATSLESDDQRKSEELLALGREVHARIPGKHGGKKRDYWYLPIVIDDRPGQLAGIFQACERVGANVEDLTIEHTPGLENGMVTLALSQSGAEALFRELSATGWIVHMPRESMG